jgi:Flp pilus assembly protein TadD
MIPPGLPHPDREARQRVMAAADGYAELGLTDLAWEEIDRLTDSDRARPEVQELMLGLLVQQRRWDEAIAAGRRLCMHGCRRPAVYIHTAFALHEAGRTAEARTTLLEGPESLRTSPLYHYNMACYLAVAGNLKDAEVCLRTAFRMDAKLRHHARHDPDLKDIRDMF